MAINIRFLRLFFLPALFLLWLAPSLRAQTAGYFLDTSSADARFIQRLVWNIDENALRYEVVIEKEEEEEYRRYQREFRNASFIEVSLPPGKYRYRIIPHDYFDRPGEGSPWKNIEVYTAHKPELHSVSPEVFYLEDGAVHTLEISGTNLIPDNTMITLRRSGTDPIVPLDTLISEDGSQARLLFNDDQLAPGIYEVFAVNPGGLEAGGELIIAEYPEPEILEEPIEAVEAEEMDEQPLPEPVKRERPLAIFINAAWMPVFPFYGQAFGQELSLPGAAVRFGFASVNLALLNAGLELAAGWYMFDSIQDGNEIDMQQAAAFELNLLTQKWLSYRVLALCFRLGAGYTLRLDGQEEPDSLMEAIYINMGISFLWAVRKHVYLEAGLDYGQLFTEIPSGSLRPWLGIGWRY